MRIELDETRELVILHQPATLKELIDFFERRKLVATKWRIIDSTQIGNINPPEGINT